MTRRNLLLALLLTAATAARAAEIPLVTDPSAGAPRVALMRNGAAFAWSSPEGLHAAVVDSRGTLAADQQLILATSNFGPAAVASNGEHALFVWTENGLVKAELLPPLNNSFNPQILGEDPGVAPPAVAWNGTRYVVVWSHVSNAIVSRTVDGNGVPESGIRVLSPGGADVARRISIASANGDSLVAWDRYTYNLPASTRATRTELAVLAADGAPRSGPRVLTASGFSPAVASNGTEFFAVWTNFDGQQLVGATVSADGTLRPEQTITAGRDAKLAWDGAHYVLLWMNPVGNRTRVYYAFLSESGALVTNAVDVGGDTSEYDVSARPQNGEVAVVVGPSTRLTSVIRVVYVDPVRARPARRF
ncbi:MAG TPA: hypothetical protein VGR02_04905 [Thermoanaerobaculia bacterium]|jgi:hypothetical protein|nr:hypothetical protein [Thermoanaerobaculia bacterium]